MGAKKKSKAGELICIECPIGCRIKVEQAGDSLKVSGAGCKKGKDFVKNEILDPKRILTTTVSIDSAISNRLPVRSDKPAPKARIEEMVKKIKDFKVKAPVKMGDIIAKDFLSTGVDIIASMSLER